MTLEIRVLAEVAGVVKELTFIEGDVVNEGYTIAVTDQS